MIAWSMIRPLPHYRAEAFAQGLAAAGFNVSKGEPRNTPVSPGDALLIWNRYGHSDQVAREFEKKGGIVFCAENGYIGAGGSVPKYDISKGPHPGNYYALALHGHNGAGQWKVGSEDRFAKLGVELKPWRKTGEHILICPSRGIGPARERPPANWSQDCVNALARITKRPVRVRQHPGNQAPERSIYEDLANAWFCVIWSSSAGVHALVNGVPVIAMGPHWICKPAAFITLDAVEMQGEAFTGFSASVLRQSVFEKLAYAQWTIEEVASGLPFRHLLSDAR